MEKKLRAKLEDELMELRQAQTGNTDPNLRPGDSIEEFRRKLSDAEEKVLMTKIIMAQLSCSQDPTTSSETVNFKKKYFLKIRDQ